MCAAAHTHYPHVTEHGCCEMDELTPPTWGFCALIPTINIWLVYLCASDDALVPISCTSQAACSAFLECALFGSIVTNVPCARMFLCIRARSSVESSSCFTTRHPLACFTFSAGRHMMTRHLLWGSTAWRPAVHVRGLGCHDVRGWGCHDGVHDLVCTPVFWTGAPRVHLRRRCCVHVAVLIGGGLRRGAHDFDTAVFFFVC